MRNQKELELLALNKYLDLTYQEYRVEKSESPDFNLKSADLSVGCEVTEYFPDYSSSGSTLKMRNAFLDKLNKRLRKKLLELFPNGYSFTIHYQPEQKGRSKISEEIEEVLHKINPDSPEASLEMPSQNIKRIVIKSIGHFPSRTMLFLSTNYESPSVDWIWPIIESKSQIATSWTNSFDQLWLLIAVGISRSSDLDLRTIKLSENMLGATWKKIALVDVSIEKVIEINAT